MVTPVIPLKVRTFGVYSDKGCNSQLATLTADGNGDTKEVEVKAGTVYIKALPAPKGYKLDSTVHSLNVEVGKNSDFDCC